MIVASGQSIIGTGVDDFRIFWRGRNPAGLATADVEPVARGDSKIRRAADDAHCRIILLRAVDVIRKIIIESDAIELRGGLVLLAPAASGVERNVGAAVVALNHAIRIVGRNP